MPGKPEDYPRNPPPPVDPVEARNPPTPVESSVMRAQDLLFEAAPDAMLAIGANGKIKYVNKQVEVLFGYDRSELENQFVEKLIPDRFRQRHVLHRDGYFAYPRIRPMGLGLNLYGLHKNGSEFPVEISLSPIGDNLAVATIRDISAWRRILDERGKEPVTRMVLSPALQYLILVVWTTLLLVLVVLNLFQN